MRSRAFQRILVLLVLFMLAVSTVSANPFLTTPPSGTAFGESTFVNRSSFVLSLSQWQQAVRDLVGDLVVRHRDGSRSIWGILVFSFVYGILHALGPGHRKTVVFSYFLQEDAKLRTGLSAGLLMSAMHAGSAIILVSFAYYLVNHSVTILVDRAGFIMERLSYGAIIAFGLYQLVGHLREHNHSHHGSPAGHGGTLKLAPEGPDEKEVSAVGESTVARTLSGRRLIILSMSAGLVPCPGVTMLMLFSISLGVIGLGIWSSLAMSVGMAATLSAVAVGTVIARRNLVKLMGDTHDRVGEVIHTTLELAGAAIMVLFGLVMLV